MDTSKLVYNYINYLQGTCSRETIKKEIETFKNENGNVEEFEKSIKEETLGIFKLKLAMEDFYKWFYPDNNSHNRIAYGTGWMKDFQKR
ncbi:MAG TPA: hypothetical protein VMZ91_10415 [Candidatus Paceibacterota bacterium]|nr:hypothetical protein [Candidatus Paceibacterota bacterium]